MTTSKKVYVNLAVRMILRIDEGTSVWDIINEMDYTFADTTGDATIADTEIMRYEIEDSK